MSFRALVTGQIAPYTLMIGDQTVDVKPHPRARRVTLRYNAKKTCFTVTMPKRTSKKFIMAFLEQNTEWMQRQQQIATPLFDPMTERLIPIEGVPRRIIHEEATGVQVMLQDDALIIRCRPERLQRALQRYLKQHAEQTIVPMVRDKAAALGKHVSEVAFRDTTSRWGSCSHSGKLSFSWRLIMAPPTVIDYVVAHEVAHLRHFDHSPDFWALCRRLSSDYTEGKHWLQLNGQGLQQIVI